MQQETDALKPDLTLPGVEVYISDAQEAVVKLAARYGKRVNTVITSPPYLWKRNYGTGAWVGGDPGCNHPAPAWADDPGAEGIGVGGGLSANAPKWLKRTGNTCPTCGARYVDRQIGIEATVEEYIAKLCDLFDAIARYLLREDGSLWVNLADTFSGSGGAGGDYNDGGLREGQPKWRPGKSTIPRKSLMFVPERFAIEMVQRGWICRNKPVWFKGNDVESPTGDEETVALTSNGMPISAKDRLKETWEQWYHFVRSNKPVRWIHQRTGQVVFKKPKQEHEVLPDGRRRPIWVGEDCTYDLDSVRVQMVKGAAGSTFTEGKTGANGLGRVSQAERVENPLGRNPGDLWFVPLAPFPLAHYACYNPKVTEIPVKTTCPEAVCRKCGTPRQAIYRIDSKPAKGRDLRKVLVPDNREQQSGNYWERPNATVIGYSNCGCGAGWEGGIILDPFFGSGSTAQGAFEARPPKVINGHACQPLVIGIDLDRRNLEIIEKRLTGRARRTGRRVDKSKFGGDLFERAADEGGN